MNKKPLKTVHDVDVAIKSYVISVLTGTTFDGFIDCTHSVMAKDFNEDLDIYQMSFNRCCRLFWQYAQRLSVNTGYKVPLIEVISPSLTFRHDSFLYGLN